MSPENSDPRIPPLVESDETQAERVEEVTSEEMPGRPKVTEVLASEARSGLSELVEATNRISGEIKSGKRRSHISREFGKPSFFESRNEPAGRKAKEITIGPVESGGSLPLTKDARLPDFSIGPVESGGSLPLTGDSSTPDFSIDPIESVGIPLTAPAPAPDFSIGPVESGGSLPLTGDSSAPDFSIDPIESVGIPLTAPAPAPDFSIGPVESGGSLPLTGDSSAPDFAIDPIESVGIPLVESPTAPEVSLDRIERVGVPLRADGSVPDFAIPKLETVGAPLAAVSGAPDFALDSIEFQGGGSIDSSNAPTDSAQVPPASAAGDVAKEVSEAAMETAADAIFFACAPVGYTDEIGIQKILEGKSKAEIDAIDAIYQRKYGLTLTDQFGREMSGSYLDKALSLLDGQFDRTDRIHNCLVELTDWVPGRSWNQTEKDIRDSISTMNSQEIAELDASYRDKHGVGIREALLQDENLSEATKKALEIYLKGTDQRTDADTEKLIDIALEFGQSPTNVRTREGQAQFQDLWEESFRGASPEARKAFMESGKGQAVELLASTTGLTLYENLRDYASEGELTTATKIRSNERFWGDNEAAIEQSLNDMTAEERQAYARGRELAATGADQATLPEGDKQAVETYQKIRAALESAGNVTELAKWEDMIVTEGGSLVTQLSAHAGTFYDSSTGAVISDIENMSQQDWERLKADPAYRGQIEGVLKTYLSDAEFQRCTNVLDKKSAAETYEQSVQLGRRPVMDAIADNTGMFSNSERAIVEAISHMTPEEQQRYRDDPEFKRELDETVTATLFEGAERDAAKHLLEKVARGEAPALDIVSELNLRAGEVEETGLFLTGGPFGSMFPSLQRGLERSTVGDENHKMALEKAAQAGDTLTGSRAADVVRDLQKAFGEDAALRERLTNPATEEDRRLAAEFDVAVRRSVSPQDYDAYVKPLLETGHLPIEKQMALSWSASDVDEQGVYKDILNATPEEKERILHDPAYQDTVLGFMSSAERKVALNVLEQGEMRPEDMIYAQQLGLGSGEEEIKAALAEVPLQDRERVTTEYQRKYESDLSTDLLSELGGLDQTQAVRLARKAPTSDQEAFDLARDDSYQSRDGIGASLVDLTWDGSGYMADDALHKYAGALSEASAKFEQLPPEQQQELNQQIQSSLDQFRESKGAAADAVVDASIAVVAVGGAFFTDGVSLGLLAATGVGAGMFKVGTKAAVQGSDYDFGSQAGLDFTTGFVDGALSFVGPGEMAAVFKVGDSAALAASEKALARGGKELIEGGKETLDSALKQAVRDAVVSGKYTIPDGSLDEIVAQVAKKGATDDDLAQLKKFIKEGLSESLETESRSALKRIGTEYALEMSSGAIGGGASGMVYGVAEWDPELSFADNMSRVATAAGTSAGFGAAGAAGFATLFKAGSTGFQAISEHYNLKPGERISPEQLDELAKMSGAEGATARYNEDGDIELIQKAPASQANLGDVPSAVDSPARTGKDSIPTNADDNKPWTPERDLTRIPNEGKEDFLARARASELYKADVVTEFVEGAEGVAGRWGDLTPLSERVAASHSALERARIQYENEIIDKLPEDMQSFGWHTDRVRKVLADNPEALEVLDAFVRRRDENGDAVKQLNKALQTRQTDLQAAVNKFANAQGLPEVKVLLQEDKFMPGAAAKYVDGTIILRKSSLLNPEEAPDLIGNMYHELAHNEQDYLIIRSLADEIRVGAELTTRQILEIKELYAERTGGTLRDEYLLKAISQRDGYYLSPENTARAKELAEAFKNNAPVGQAWIDAGNTFRTVRGDLKRLEEGNDGSFKLIRDIAGNAKHAQRLFGDEIPPDVRVLIDLYQRKVKGEDIAWPDEKAKEVLTDHITRRMEGINVERREAYDRYMAGSHEQEAFVIGERARLMAEHSDVPEPRGTTGGPEDVTVGLPRRTADTLVPVETSEVLDGIDTSDRRTVDMRVDAMDLGPKNPDGTIKEDLGSSALVTIGGEEYELVREGGDQWYYGKEPPKVSKSPVKVHVFGVDAEDLGRLQEVLIPALNDSESGLADLVTGWKTMDPRYAVGDAGARGIGPGTSDQSAKAFTIFAGSAEHALRIQSKIDQILSAHPELRLDEIIDTGNVDRVAELSGRVGVCRELYIASPDSTPAKPLILIDKVLADRIHADLGSTSGNLSYAQLRALEISTQMEPNTLTYDSLGNLVLKCGPKSSYQGDAIYVPELGAGKGMDVDGKLKTDRPALYALAQRYGIDQADIAAGRTGTDPSDEVTEVFERPTDVLEDAPTEEIPLPANKKR